ncbi:putative uncharacterized protein [Bacteroides sp. CAG:144]|nr:putative uncharacterized protein [Bacteroides sp. CAG:144]
MKKLVSLFLLFLPMLMSAESEGVTALKPLTSDQKVIDFEYLYAVLRDNYPFFGVAERKYGVDWLAKHDEYVLRLKATADDAAYYRELNSILRELHDGHLDFSPTIKYSKFKPILDGLGPDFEPWSRAMHRDSVRAVYWEQLLAKKDVEHKPVKKKSLPKQRGKKSYYADTLLCNGKIALMRLSSLPYEKISVDSLRIASFLSTISEADYLIIDIQGNSGGSELYWSRLVVSRLIPKPITYFSTQIVRGGEINREYCPEFFEEAESLTGEVCSGLPDELYDGTFYLRKYPCEVAASDPIAFRGKIYLLVDRKVFSSAGGWADFCKQTGWATVVGETTGVQGIGRDPIVISLPESGLLLRYPYCNGINADGTFNGEVGVRPDIEIHGKDRNERLQNLIEYLSAL